MSAEGADKRVTVVDVAKKANVSTITVSRAFSSPQLVKKATRDLIYKVAAELNYTPNPFARSLKSNTSHIIGVVTDSTYNPVYAQVVKTLCNAADKYGYMVMMFETSGDAQKEQRAIEALFSYKVAGIVLSVAKDTHDYNPDYFDKAAKSNIPLVLLDRDVPMRSLPGVFLNNHEIGIKAGVYLNSMHIDKLLIIGGPESSIITQDRVGGICAALAESKTDHEVCYCSYTYEQARAMLMEYLKDYKAKGLKPFTHAVGINGPITLSAIGVFRSLGCKDLSYFSIDEVPYMNDFGYKIPCIYSDPVEWGECISKLLFKLIDHNNSPAFFDRMFIHGHLKE